MLRYVLFDLRLFNTESARESSQKGLLWLLESLARWNYIFLGDFPNTPKMYRMHAQGRIRYKLPEQFKTTGQSSLTVLRSALDRAGLLSDSEVHASFEEIQSMCGGERFRDIPAVIENGGGDCDNISAWRVAELRNAGIQAMPYITWRRRGDGGMTYHALVRWPDGSSEDPSLILGMGGESKAAERWEELRKNEERAQTAVEAVHRAKINHP